LTRASQARYDPATTEGAVIPDTHGETYDLDRLERALQALVASHQRLQRENSDLRAHAHGTEQRVRELEEQLLDANQRRQEVGKRVDELISQLDHLDAELARSEATHP
jgi:septal ring factor EnvC (AmiA/AmiB activator)